MRIRIIILWWRCIENTVSITWSSGITISTECRYCNNMAKSGVNPKTLQYLMGIAILEKVTLNAYTRLGLEDTTDEVKRMEDLKIVRKELEEAKDKKLLSKHVPAI